MRLQKVPSYIVTKPPKPGFVGFGITSLGGYLGFLGGTGVRSPKPLLVTALPSGKKDGTLTVRVLSRDNGGLVNALHFTTVDCADGSMQPGDQ